MDLCKPLVDAEEAKTDSYKPLVDAEKGKTDSYKDLSHDHIEKFDQWSFYRTVAYWISIMFLEGSTLFIVGAFFSMLDLAGKTERNSKALVTLPYFVGGICFTLGAYFGIIEVVNVPKGMDRGFKGHFGTGYDLFLTGRTQWKKMKDAGVSWNGLMGYTVYFMGASFFQINVFCGFFTLTDDEGTWIEWFMAVCGSICFCVGVYYECMSNKVLTEPNIYKIGQWLAVCNVIGGVFFLIAATGGMTKKFDEVQERWLVDFTYLIGSIAFAAGSMISLHMWKDEQYGLGLVPHLNSPSHRHANEKGAHDQRYKDLEKYGCGKSSILQLPWLWLYIINSSASVIELGGESYSTDPSFVKITSAVLNMALCHGILLLGSVIHHVPTAAPANWLLIYMRIVLLFYCANNVVKAHDVLD